MKINYRNKINAIMLAVMSAVAMNASAQTDAALADSLYLDSIANAFDKKVELQEVEVKGTSMIRKADRQLYVPSAEQIKGATDGTDLLRKLSIPNLVINSLDNTIALASSGALDVRVNGRKVNPKELKGIDPRYVVRVEYHDNPSMRYGNAEAVVDLIVKQPTSGGSVALNLAQSVNRGWGEDNFSVKLNNKKSEFSYNGYLGPRWNFDQWRDNTENYMRKDGSLYQRVEKGVPSDFKMLNTWNQLGYNFSDPGKQMFSAQVNMWSDRFWHNDYEGILTNTDTGISNKMMEKTKQNSYSPTLDLYYQRNLKNDQLLMVNVVAGVTPSHSERCYTEYLMTGDEVAADPMVDIKTKLEGRTYNLVGQADYEKTWKNSRLTAGASHTQSWSNNTYKMLDVEDNMRLATTYVYSEYWRRLGNKFDMTLGVGTSRYYNNQVGVKKSTSWVFRPKVNLRYVADSHSTLRLDFHSYGNAPSLGQLTNVEQVIDNNQTLVGNANLKTFTSYKLNLQYEFNKDWFYGRLRGEFQYHHKPIMEDKYWGENSIVSTYANHRNAYIQKYEFTFRLEPIKNWLTLSGNVGWSRFIMHGNDYTHCYNNAYFNGQMELTHWNFTLQAAMITNQNSFWGESLNGGENVHIVVLTYKYKDFNFGIGALNPFANNYKRETENWNRYAGFKRATHFGAAQQIVGIVASWNFQWGRKHNAEQKRLNNDAKGESLKAGGKG